MQKLLGAALLLVVLAFLQTNAFAYSLNCKFKNAKVEGIQTITLTEEALYINDDLEIPLEKSLVRCAHLGRQKRMEGEANGLQVILKTCSTEAQVAGHLIDFEKEKSAEVICDQRL